MMLVYDETVVTELVTQHELVDIFLVKLVTLFRIEMAIGDIDPLALRAARYHIGVRHEVHQIKLQWIQCRHRHLPVWQALKGAPRSIFREIIVCYYYVGKGI